MTFEHSIVNMCLFPSALIMGGNLSIMDYIIRKEFPTLLGNIGDSVVFTGLLLYRPHTGSSDTRDPVAMVAAAE